MQLMRFFALLAASGVLAFAAGTPTVDEIMRRSCERESRDLEIRRQYTFRRTDDVKQNGKDGSSKQRELKTWEILYIDGTEYKRLVEKDGKPLNDKDAREEQEKMDREIQKRRNESASDRKRRLDKDRKELDDERQVRLELPNAYNFELLGEENVQGRPSWKIRAEPKPGYEPVHKEAKVFPKLHGTLWIDQGTYV